MEKRADDGEEWHEVVQRAVAVVDVLCTYGAIEEEKEEEEEEELGGFSRENL